MSWVGKNIDTLCPRCKLVLAHVVLYEVAGSIRGVKCKTCGSEHRYRGPKRQEIPAGHRPRTGREATRPTPPVRPTDARLWELRMAVAVPDAPVWPFKLSENYEKGDWIDHPRFGRGFVEKATADRMEVLFREGRKLLAMNRPTTAPAR
ncbi:MAG: hypothetical protein FWE89_01175 [Syntrophaceae bacterium]|nr:hypothetical protein [Syntrophaceae bacterium]